MSAVSMDLSYYELVWPVELFVAEGERVVRHTGRWWSEQAVWLLTEALTGTTAVADFEELPSQQPDDNNPWNSHQFSRGIHHVVTQREWLSELVSRASELRKFSSPKPYWTQRAVRKVSRSTQADARNEFADIVRTFSGNGYLVEVFGDECVDDRSELPDPAAEIERRLGVPGLWPLQPETWDEDVFYGLIEVFHDLVSRPRRRIYHSFSSCGWHYHEFHAGPARTLYQHRVNEMLSNSGIEYRIAIEGEDLGRMISVTDDARSRLVHQALNAAQPSIRERTEHAVALFRGRGASPEMKRSAIVALAGILEERRGILKEELLSNDEGHLFMVMNKFGLRHRDASQHTDYDDAFLDWIFWWFMATVELTNQIIAARTLSAPPGPRSTNNRLT
ncbi:hypothetical protein OG728_38590 (plasmid) [Streptomyces microflavus]|nr:hypothetical protein OG728_38590 [Streptomyces microflavus]WTF70134.1 hypothetical protein OH770_16530 [Streptomyces microflavus]